MIPIVLATGNPHKIAELRAIFAPAGLPILTLPELTGARPHEPEETGRTFEENAAIKALSYAQQTGQVCLADDSGLEVDALGGAPGVISSHYATDGAEKGWTRAHRDEANNARLLRELDGVPDAQRTARFVCVMVAADPSGAVVARSRGVFEGRIGVPPAVPRGENGFGYDPLFVLPRPEMRTSAELSAEEKNRLSHRGAAARSVAAMLRALP
jgi:XTP/dITP diphosphohydrolase